MKHSAVCPKCGGTEILRIDGRSVIGGVIPAGWTGAKLNRFLCTVCGYSEEWIAQKDIAKLIADLKGPGAEHLSIYRKQEDS